MTTDLLAKEEPIALPGIQKLTVELSWNSKQPMECDLMAFLLDESGTIPSRWDIIFYNVPTHTSKSVFHQGLRQTETGGHDQIDFRLADIPDQFQRILLLSCVYEARERGQSLADAEELTLRLSDGASEKAAYSFPTENSEARSIFLGALVRQDGGWGFQAIGKEDEEQLIGVLAVRYGMRVDWRSDYKHFNPDAGIFA